MDQDRNELMKIALARKPSEHDPSEIFPMILPFGLLDGGWTGPILPLTDLPFALGWAVVSKPNLFVHVSYEMAQYWEDAGIDWPEEAMKNLRRLVQAKRRSGGKEDKDGRTIVVVILTDDTIGPSRLLIPDLFEDLLGENYLVAIPEETCAIAYRNDLSEAEMAEVDGLIQGCYQAGTKPMSPERFDPRRFWVTGISVKLMCPSDQDIS